MAHFNRDELVMGFQQATGCKLPQALRHTHAYIRHSVAQILSHLNKHTQSDAVYVSFTAIQNALSSIMVQGRRFYVWQVFQALPQRIFVPVIIGNNIHEKLTMTKLNYDLEELLIAAGDSTQLVNLLYQIKPDDAVEHIQIDLSSLRSYIAANLAIDRKDPRQTRRIPALNNYLYHALRIQLIAEANAGMMPHVIAESEFGRRYYRGPNLQNTPKVVRLAALGTGHEYDIESSVFAWKLSMITQLAHAVGDTVSFPYTLDYLDHKTAMRRRITQEVFDSTEAGYTKIIKQAITAIGFGAPARLTGYTVNGKYEPAALNTIITASTRLQRFLTDSWVKGFVQEQQTMNKFIFDYAVLTQEQELRSVRGLVTPQGRLRSNSVVSYLYQHHERAIMDYIVAECADSDIRLVVHDCVYTRRPVRLREIREGIMKFGPYYRITHEPHQGYAYDPDLEAHQARIRAEEQFAAQVFGKPVHNPRPRPRPQRSATTDLYDSPALYEANYDPDLDPYLEEI